MRSQSVAGVLLTIVIGFACGVECAMGATGGACLFSGDWFSQVQEKIRKEEYQITWRAKCEDGMPSSFQAPNRALGLRTYFGKDGITVVSRTEKFPSWEMRLRAIGIGRGNQSNPLPPAVTEIKGSTITYRRGNVEEWYNNDPEGIEQGFTLKSKPKGTGMLEIQLVLGPGWKGKVSDGGIELSGPGGAAKLAYRNLTVVDASGEEVPSGLVAEGRVITIRIDDKKAVYPIVVDPMIAVAPSMVEGERLLGMKGWAVSSAGDVNGDGYADVIVGEPGYDGRAGANSGKVYVYYGSATGLSTTAAWSVEGDQADVRLGWTVANAGDVNGDGYSDVIVGSPYFKNSVGTNIGKVFVYHGSRDGLCGTAAWSVEGDHDDAELGYSVSSAGDVNGDGFSDIIVGAPLYNRVGDTAAGKVYVYHGSATGLTTNGVWSTEGEAGSCLGGSVSNAGDVNGDGFSDIVVGAPTYSGAAGANAGKAYVYHGSATGLSTCAAWNVEGDQADGNMGLSVSSAGDVNGDGFSDVIVGMPGNGGSVENYPGKVFLYHGSAAGLSTSAAWSVEGDESNYRMGFSVSSAGDLNGDGFSDVLIEAHHCDEKPCIIDSRFFLYPGSGSGLGTTAAWSTTCKRGGYYYGKSSGSAGDVNGDGFADLIIGNPGYLNGLGLEVGAAFVYYGSACGLDQSASWTDSGQQEGAKLGFAVSGAGDVNGDGYADMIVGVPNFDGGVVDQGRAYIFMGGSYGPVSTPAWVYDGNQTGALFGYSVAGGGDTNKDGFADIVVGSPGFSTPQHANAGKVFVFRGSSAGPLTSPAWTAKGSSTGALFGWSVAAAGDLNGDGFADIVVGSPGYKNARARVGAAYVFAGSKRNKRILMWSYEGSYARGQFGYSVSGAGDVNKDGFDDLIIGAPFQKNIFAREGAAFIFHGASTGPGSLAARTLYGHQKDGQFGFSVSKSGDVNGDGYSGVIVGAPYYRSNGVTGAAFIFPGSRRGIKGAAFFSLYGQQVGERFGYSVSSAGDVDGDGLEDVIIGAPFHSDTGADQGAAYILSYSQGSFRTVWSAFGGQPGSYFGYSVSGAGDVNSDGLADVIIGAPGLNAIGIAGGGEVYVYY